MTDEPKSILLTAEENQKFFTSMFAVAVDSAIFYGGNYAVSAGGISKRPRLRHVIIYAIIDAMNRYFEKNAIFNYFNRPSYNKFLYREAVVSAEYFLASCIYEAAVLKRTSFGGIIGGNLIRGLVGLAGNAATDHFIIPETYN